MRQQLHSYVVQERHPNLEPRRCARDECFEVGTYDVALDLVGLSGAISPGPKTPLCGPHTVDWLRFSF